MVSFVVFLIVTEPTVPRFAVRSTSAGVIETPPCWVTRAAGAASSARAITAPVAVPATARPRAPAASRVLARFTSGISLFLLLGGAEHALRRLGGQRGQDDLPVAPGGLASDLLAKVDGRLGAGRRTGPARDQRADRGVEPLEGALADAGLQRERQPLGAARQVAELGTARELAVGQGEHG